MNKIIAFSLFIICLAASSAAHAACHLPITFIPHAVLTADQLNQNFTALSDCITTASVIDYGAVCDNVHDDSAAIQAAINAVAASGTRALNIPAGKTCYIGTTTLVIGNGSSAAWSSYQGVVLLGIPSANATPGIVGDPNVPVARIRYAGTGEAIKIAGPLNGWGVSGLQIECSTLSATSIGLNVISANYGWSPNLSTLNCGSGVKEDVVATQPPGVSVTNSMHNYFQNLQITINATTADVYHGVWETGNALGNSSFNNFFNTTVYAQGVSGSTIYDLRLAATDSDEINNFHAYGVTNGTGGVTRHVVVFDYANPGSTGWPAGTTLSSIENTKGQAINIGTPAANTAANYWNNVKYTNGGTAPILPALITDFAKGTWTPSLEGSIIPGSFTYPPNSQFGDYEISGFDVTARLHVVTSAVSGASGALVVSGLPVPSASQASTVRGGCTVMGYSGLTLGASYNGLSAWVDTTINKIVFVKSGDGLSSMAFISSSADVAATTRLDVQCTYRRATVY